MLAQKRATTSRPSYSNGIGGIEVKTSSVIRATSALRSADSHALTNFATIASSEGEPEAGRRFAVGGRRPSALEAGAGPFEGAVDRFHARLQHVGHLVRVESEDVAQDEHGDLPRRATWDSSKGTRNWATLLPSNRAVGGDAAGRACVGCELHIGVPRAWWLG